MTNAEQKDRSVVHVRSIVASLLLVHTGLLAYSAYVHSPTLNEPGHLVAGISHWRFGRFELYRVNPPLVRMIAALPVMAAGAETDWRGFEEDPGARPVFGMGGRFLAVNGERSFWLFTIARWACIPFSLLGGYVCFRWARELYGEPAGILALALWCFSPNIIAHGSLITPDSGATALGVTAAYFFWRWLKQPTWSRVLVAGVTLGLAELTKMTWIILFGLWPLVWLIWQCSSDRRRQLRAWLIQAAQMALVLSIALYVLNLGYGFEGSFNRPRDFRFVSRSLTSDGEEEDHVKNRQGKNRFADSWLGTIPLPVPRHYVLGMDVQKRDFENFGRLSYLRGEFRDRGWWYYYLYGLAIKVPLGTWLLILLATWLRFRRWDCSATWRDEIVLLVPLAAVLALVSSQTGFNHHMRYVLPIFPFAFIATSCVAGAVSWKQWRIAFFAVVVLAWSVGSSLWIYPHSLSYFNELAGGPTGGHAHLINSNIDWGQDLLYLRRWLDDHPEARPVYLVYYGRVDPRAAGIEHTLPPQPLQGNNDRSHLQVLRPGWYAISVNYLRGFSYLAPDETGIRREVPENAYSFLLDFPPEAMAGFSIYIYHLTPEDITRVQREMEVF